MLMAPGVIVACDTCQIWKWYSGLMCVAISWWHWKKSANNKDRKFVSHYAKFAVLHWRQGWGIMIYPAFNVIPVQ